MIQELREYSQSFLFKLLLGVICVTFVVSFGVGSFGDRKEVIAKVNGREILLKDYRKAYQNRLQSLRQQFGENADAFAEQINLRQRVFEQMIDQELLAIEAEKMNLEATIWNCRKKSAISLISKKTGILILKPTTPF